MPGVRLSVWSYRGKLEELVPPSPDLIWRAKSAQPGVCCTFEPVRLYSVQVALDRCGKSLGGDEHVAVHYELFHLLPVDLSEIQPQPDPPLCGT